MPLPSGRQPNPSFLAGTPPPRPAGRSSNRGRRCKPVRTSQRRRDVPRRAPSSGPHGGTDGNRPGTGTRGHAGGYTGCPLGPPVSTDGNRPGYSTRGECRDIDGMLRSPRRAPWKWMSPRRRGRQPTTPDRVPGPQPIPTHPECGSAQCRGARAARGCRRRDGAACIRRFPTSARCTYEQVRPHRMPGMTPTASGSAWLSERYHHKGRGARDYAAPRLYGRHWSWVTRPPQYKHTRHWQGHSRRAWISYTYWGFESPRCAGSPSRPSPRAPGH